MVPALSVDRSQVVNGCELAEAITYAQISQDMHRSRHRQSSSACGILNEVMTPTYGAYLLGGICR